MAPIQEKLKEDLGKLTTFCVDLKRSPFVRVTQLQHSKFEEGGSIKPKLTWLLVAAKDLIALDLSIDLART